MIREDHDIMCEFCLTIQKLGLAPYGLNLLFYEYITPSLHKDFIYRFWTEEKET